MLKAVLLFTLISFVTSQNVVAPIWTTNFNATYSPDGTKPSFSSIFADDLWIVMVQDTNSIFRLDKATGKIIWSWTPPENFCSVQYCRLQTNIQYSNQRKLIAFVAVSPNEEKPAATLGVLGIHGDLKWTMALVGGTYRSTYFMKYAAADQLLLFNERAPEMISLNITDGLALWKVNNKTIYQACWASTVGIEYDVITGLIISQCVLHTYAFRLNGDLVWDLYQTSLGYKLGPGMYLSSDVNSVCSIPLTNPHSPPSWCYKCASCNYWSYSGTDILVLTSYGSFPNNGFGLASLTHDGKVKWTVPTFSEIYIPFTVRTWNNNYLFNINQKVGQSNIVEVDRDKGSIVSSVLVGYQFITAIYADPKLIFAGLSFNTLMAYAK